MQKNLTIDRLSAGGLIANYYCSATCAHCLYACSPHWPKTYIRKSVLTKNLRMIKTLGCRSIHVGGGEPFLDTDGLLMVLEAAGDRGLRIEYVETNSSWYTEPAKATNLLRTMKQEGLTTLLVSMSPFHNAHIPFWKVKGVVRACEHAGIRVFPWIADFYNEIDSFDDRKTHSLTEYEQKFGPGYLKRLPGRYWIHYGGRALETFAEVLETRPCETIISGAAGGCSELANVGHFHFDLFGNYIPGLCSGIAIRNADLGKELSEDAYPLVNLLFRQGVRGLYDHAAARYGFNPTRRYLSKCDLCFDIRRNLVREARLKTHELQPLEFYEQSRKCSA